jgi:6-phosphogluconolactonase
MDGRTPWRLAGRHGLGFKDWFWDETGVGMTGLIHLHPSPNAAQLAQALAVFVAERLRAGLAARGQALLIVSGGSTPVPFFEALAAQPLDWPHVTVALADERWLPPDHADSNERLVRAHLLHGPAAQARWVPMFDGQASPEGAAPDIERRLAALPWPADVVVLGMGGDGHTASLFPHAPELAAALHVGQPARCVAVGVPQAPNVPVPRISLTPRALLDARLLVLHITGQAKLDLLARAQAEGPVADMPIRLVVRQTQVPCHVFHSP